MRSPAPMADDKSNGMAAMIGERDRRKPVAAHLEAFY
jgi:hypothetical protein